MECLSKCKRINKNYTCSNVFEAFFVIQNFIKTDFFDYQIITTALFLLEQARLQRGNVLLKQGRLDEAHIDYEAVVRLGFVVLFTSLIKRKIKCHLLQMNAKQC